MTIREKWNARYAETTQLPVPARVLVDNCHLLPKVGKGLDLACGLGGNALMLAEHGLETLAWDISDVAVRRLNDFSFAQSLPLTAEVRDVVSCPPPEGVFDCVVVSRFLDRGIAAPIAASLKPGGVLFFQTFVYEKVTASGPENPEYLLGCNELLRMFCNLRLLVYREEGRVGDTGVGWRDEALLVGMRVN